MSQSTDTANANRIRSDRPQENQHLVKLPEKFVTRWIIEIVRLYQLSEVLYRSTTYLEDSRSARPVGDSTLVEHIKRSLKALFIEIEEVRDGHWERRSSEVEDE